MSRAKKEGPHWDSEARQEREGTSRGQHLSPQWNGMPQRPNSGLAALGMESFCVLTYHLPRVALVSVLLFPESTHPQENITSSSRSCPTSVAPVLHTCCYSLTLVTIIFIRATVATYKRLCRSTCGLVLLSYSALEGGLPSLRF